ncbi:MAG: chemotaxis protein CheW [Myxococcota bacterium]
MTTNLITGAESAEAQPESLAGGFPWVLCTLSDNTFGLSAEQVESMVQLPAVTVVPNTPMHVRGVMNLRGRVLRVVDLRLRLGLPPLEQERMQFEMMIDQREQEHRMYVEELEASVLDDRPFTLTTNPKESAFGRWHDTYKTSSPILRGLLEGFREPHERIHAIAREVESLKGSGRLADAQELIRKTRDGDLATMFHLFGELKATYRRITQEIALVLSDGQSTSAVVVDSVLSVEHLNPVQGEAERNALGGIDRVDLLVGLARRQKSEDENLILLLDAATLVTG